MNNLETNNPELIEAKKLTEFVKNEDYNSIRKYIGKKYNKMYTFSGKNNLVWSSFILFNNHPELNQEYSLDIELPEKENLVSYHIGYMINMYLVEIKDINSSLIIH